MAYQSTDSVYHYECPHCDFTTSSQSGVGIHCIKSHPIDDSLIELVSVVRQFPEGKKFSCCLCGNIIGSFPSFKRHFANVHKNVSLVSSGHCSICNKDFPTAQGVGVHCKREHNISKKKASRLTSISRTPIASIPKFRSSADSPPVMPPRTTSTAPSIVADATVSSPANNLLINDHVDAVIPPYSVTSSSSSSTTSNNVSTPPSLNFEPSIVEFPTSPVHHDHICSPISEAPRQDDSIFEIPPPLSPSYGLLSNVTSIPPPPNSSQSFSSITSNQHVDPHPTQVNHSSDPLSYHVNSNAPISGSSSNIDLSGNSENLELGDFHNKWFNTFSSVLTWDDFSSKCSSFAKDVVQIAQLKESKNKPTARRPDRPSSRPISNNRRPLQRDPVAAARKIQGLYRFSLETCCQENIK